MLFGKRLSVGVTRRFFAQLCCHHRIRIFYCHINYFVVAHVVVLYIVVVAVAVYVCAPENIRCIIILLLLLSVKIRTHFVVGVVVVVVFGRQQFSTHIIQCC